MADISEDSCQVPPPAPLLDITNFPATWDNCNLQTMSILNAIDRVLRESGTPEWKINMLSLQRYHRVKFKFRNTIRCFLDYMKIIAGHKENENYPPHKLYNMRRIMRDITNWVLQRRAYFIDDSHWPLDEQHVAFYREVYAAYPDWVDNSFMTADSYFCTVLEQKRMVEDAFSFNVEENALPIEDEAGPTAVQMYVDGNLVPPPLENDCEIAHFTV